MQRSTPFVLATLVLLGVASCAAPTEDGGGHVQVAIDTDIAVPTAMDGLEVELTDSEGGTPFFQVYTLGKEATLPATLELTVKGRSIRTKGSLPPGAVAVGEPGSPLSVIVRGTLRGQTVVAREAQLALPADDRRLSLPLTTSCAGKTCGPRTTCDAGQCIEVAVDVTRLPVVR